MMSVKISCIVPYYNVEKNLMLQCIKSILNQDFEDYEILIIDDGSEENYVAYLDEVRDLDSRIEIIHQPNKGVSSARNTGIIHARGEYISFVDADDMVAPFFFSEAYRIAMDYDAEYIEGCVLATQSRNQTLYQNHSPKIEIRDSEQYRCSIIMITDRIQNGGYFGRGPWARLIKKEVVKKTFFPENVKLGEDIIWNLDILLNCKKVYMVYQIWYKYWKNPTSVSHKYNSNIVFICEQHLKELIKRINLQNEEEAKVYLWHVYELLRQHVYECYLGRKECSLSVFKKNQMFRELSKKEPWTMYQVGIVLKHCDRNTRIKYHLIKFGLLYWYWFLKDHLIKNNRT